MTSVSEDMALEGMESCLAHLYQLLLGQARLLSMGKEDPSLREATYRVYKKGWGAALFWLTVQVLCSFVMPASRQQDELSVHLKLWADSSWSPVLTGTPGPFTLLLSVRVTHTPLTSWRLPTGHPRPALHGEREAIRREWPHFPTSKYSKLSAFTPIHCRIHVPRGYRLLSCFGHCFIASA